jgi:hypothetical protein
MGTTHGIQDGDAMELIAICTNSGKKVKFGPFSVFLPHGWSEERPRGFSNKPAIFPYGGYPDAF